VHLACALVDEAGDLCSFLAAAKLPEDLQKEADLVLARVRRELQALAGRIETAGWDGWAAPDLTVE
jgi:hypothetical protein